MRYGTVRRRRLPFLLAAIALAGSLLTACSTLDSAATWNDPRHPVAGGDATGAGPAPLWTGARHRRAHRHAVS